MINEAIKVYFKTAIICLSISIINLAIISKFLANFRFKNDFVRTKSLIALSAFVPSFNFAIVIGILLTIYIELLFVFDGRGIFADNITKMNEAEEYVYLKHKNIFGALFLDWYVEKEIRKAVKKRQCSM